jgi:hypothetical protein
MIKRRAVIGLFLLCALFLCAVTAQSASAGQTAWTCVKGQGKLDFEDVHCDKTAPTPGTGTWGHVEITENMKTEVTANNEKTATETTAFTPTVLKGTIGAIKAELSCSTIHATGTFTNVTEGGVMKNVGEKIVIKNSGCTVLQPAKCTVKEFSLKGTSTTVEGLGAGKNEMGLELKPEAGKPFTEFFFSGSECAIKGEGKSVPLTGTLIATPGPGATAKESGGTLVFTNAMTKETLKIGGTPVEMSSILTLKMKSTPEEEEKGENKQNAISFTTQ